MEQRARDWVAANGGIVLEAPAFKDDNGNRHWRVVCKNAHEWAPQIAHLAYARSWCAKCYGNAKLTLESLEELAKSRGGFLWAEEYDNNKTPMLWECAEGHDWFATAGNVKNHGSWCPKCVINVGEELVRAALVEAFPERTFDRTRLVEWMEGLELDGYNADLCLAYEYQGIQHFVQDAFFHEDEDAFQRQLERDQRKLALCAANGVQLLVVPHHVPYHALRGYVRGKIVDLGFEPAPGAPNDDEFYNMVRSGSRQQAQYQRLCAIVAAKGGVCLSSRYIGYRVPVQIRCREGHPFSASLEAIDQPLHRGPRFCPECGGTRKKTDEEHRIVVEQCGFVYRGTDRYTDESGKARTRIYVCCPNQHEYDVLWDNFKPTDSDPDVPKRGCSACFEGRRGANNRSDISEWCKANDVEPLEPYRNQNTVMQWLCSEGHTFEGKLLGLKARQRHACPRCAIAKVEAEHSVTLIGAWRDKKPSFPLSWICNICNARIRRSLMVLGKKGKICDACH